MMVGVPIRSGPEIHYAFRGWLQSPRRTGRISGADEKYIFVRKSVFFG